MSVAASSPKVPRSNNPFREDGELSPFSRVGRVTHREISARDDHIAVPKRQATENGTLPASSFDDWMTTPYASEARGSIVSNPSGNRGYFASASNWYRDLLIGNSGTLYRDDAIDITMEIDSKGQDQLHFILKVVNLHRNSIHITIEPEARLRQEYAFHFERYAGDIPSDHSRLHHGKITMHRPYDSPPAICINYHDGEGVKNTTRVRLPLAALRFVRPVVLPSGEFFSLWGDASMSEVKNVVPLRHAFLHSAGHLDLAQALTAGRALEHLPDLDERKESYILAGAFRSHGNVLVRVEVGQPGTRREGLALVTTRSAGRTVARAIHHAMLELLCESNPMAGQQQSV